MKLPPLKLPRLDAGVAQNLCALAGAVATSHGVWSVNHAAGEIVGGLFLLATAYLLARAAA